MSTLKRVFQEYLTRGTIKGDTFRIAFLQVFILGISLLINVIVARTLGPEGKGTVDIFRLLNSFIAEFGLFGFGTGLLYYQVNRATPLREINTSSIIFSLISGILTIAIGLIFFPYWKSVFSGLHYWAIISAFILSPFAYYIILWNNIAMGMNQALLFYKITLVFNSVTMAGILVFWAFNLLTIVAIIELSIFITIANSIGAFVMLFRKDFHFHFNLQLMKNSLSYGGIYYLGALANVVNFRIDQLLINHYSGIASVGIYAVSVRLAELLFFLDAAVNAAALYKIGASSFEDGYRVARRIFRLQLAVSGIAGIVMMFMAYPLILLLYGRQYAGAAFPLVVLVPGVVLWSAAKILSVYLTYNRGKVRLPALFAVLGAFINICLNLWLIPILGIVGASLASLFSYVCVFMITIIAFRREGLSSIRVNTPGDKK